MVPLIPKKQRKLEFFARGLSSVELLQGSLFIFVGLRAFRGLHCSRGIRYDRKLLGSLGHGKVSGTGTVKLLAHAAMLKLFVLVLVSRVRLSTKG